MRLTLNPILALLGMTSVCLAGDTYRCQYTGGCATTMCFGGADSCLAVLRRYIQQVDDDTLYRSSLVGGPPEPIACVQTGSREGLCAHVQGGASIRGSEVKQRFDELLGFGCTSCGTVFTGNAFGAALVVDLLNHPCRYGSGVCQPPVVSRALPRERAQTEVQKRDCGNENGNGLIEVDLGAENERYGPWRGRERGGGDGNQGCGNGNGNGLIEVDLGAGNERWANGRLLVRR